MQQAVRILIQNSPSANLTGGNPNLCECGKCRLPAPIAKKTDARRGWVKGQPHRFINGHYWTEKGPNTVRHLDDGTSVLILERKNGSDLERVIDTINYDKVKDYRWFAVEQHKIFASKRGFHSREINAYSSINVVAGL